MTAAPIINIPRQSGTCITKDESTLTHHNHPHKVHTLHYGSLLVLYILCVWTNVWWHISIIIISYRVLSSLYKSSMLCLFISPPTTSHPHPATTDLSIVSIVLLFPECHIVGIIESRLIPDLSSFLIYSCNAINFPPSTAFPTYHKFSSHQLCFHFHLAQNILKILLRFFWPGAI